MNNARQYAGSIVENLTHLLRIVYGGISKMFVTNKKFKAYQQNMKEELEYVRKQYWAMYYKHSVLLNHLNLTERIICQTTILEEKVGRK